MYILKCSNDSYYKGSTNNLQLCLQQHNNGEGFHITRENLPVKLVYYEEYQRLIKAYYRKKIKLTGKMDQINKLLIHKVSKVKIAKQLGVHRSTLRRFLQ